MQSLSHLKDNNWNETTAVPNWIRSRIGDLAILRIRQDDIEFESNSYSAFSSSNNSRVSGITYLVRVEDNDRKLPLRIHPEDDLCQPMSLDLTLVVLPDYCETDCTDFETLAAMMFTQIAQQMAEGLMNASSDLNLALFDQHFNVVPALQATRTKFRALPLFTVLKFQGILTALRYLKRPFMRQYPFNLTSTIVSLIHYM
ncbi:hypothetical protein [Glaciecola sp. 1036]|uniref:hypothetical protein n=1 Tax=Alteromonadaceae TaxID=72275 RepID=UPI003CFD366E